MSYFIGVCVEDELDGTRQDIEISVKATTDEDARRAFDIWKEANPAIFNGAPIVGEPKLFFMKRVA
ncbi:MAG: hypothetical protein P1P90_00125 [Patescibacteria group bacterium]|nr:hypothetical protein [Patescibacteria group bacterium]